MPERREVTAVVAEPDEMLSAGQNRATADGFRPLGRVEVLESRIVDEDTVIAGERVRAGSWVVTARVPPGPMWDSIKRRECTGITITGNALLVRPRAFWWHFWLWPVRAWRWCGRRGW